MNVPASAAPERPPGRYDGTRHAVQVGAGPVAVSVAALGVVFGDIGTSPLYAMQTVFSADDGAVRATTGDVYGVISLVLWTLTVVVSLKYVSFVMRADNDGEGGIMALTALVRAAPLRNRRVKGALVLAGLLGVALFYGDGMITPAISVLSAVEGVKVVAPGLDSMVVPATVAILVGLFAIQRFGTGFVGRLFGPVMALWFAAIAAAGLAEVIRHPEILRALSPTYGLAFVGDHPGIAFIALGSIVLAVTGAEALYADIGHFGAAPIRRAWFAVAFPALGLNYLGQGSLILHAPSAISNPFFLLVPEWAQVPMVVLATIATVIASQALITGAFSITRQAIQLRYLPRLTVRHTSEREIGQVYVPVVNWGLLAAVVAIVVGFGSSTRLASAYGVAVTGTFVVTTILFAVVARHRWRVPLRWLVPGIGILLIVDLSFFTANLTKVVHGGWLPLVIALVVFTLLTTWRWGSRRLAVSRRTEEGPLAAFVDGLSRRVPLPRRVPGTAVFLSAAHGTVPLALRENVEHNHVLHERVAIVSVETVAVPRVPPGEQISVVTAEDEPTVLSLTLRFGFVDRPDVPRALRRAVDDGVVPELDVEEAVYVLSQARLVPNRRPGLRGLRGRLFALLERNAASPVDYFGLPPERTMTIGSPIEI